jgi:chromosome segregation ATPase
VGSQDGVDDVERLIADYDTYLDRLRREAKDEFTALAQRNQTTDEIEYGKQWITRELAAFEAGKKAEEERKRRVAAHPLAHGELDERIAEAREACAEIEAAIDVVKGEGSGLAELRASIAKGTQAFLTLDVALEVSGL